MRVPRISGFLATMLFAMAVCGIAPAAEIHLALDGDDAASGSSEEPFRTFARARRAVVSLRAGGEAEGGITVVVHGGTWQLARTLEFTSTDSGTAKTPVTWRAAAGEQVRLVAGRMVEGFGPVRDPAVRGRLDPAARGRVLCADLKGQGITDYGDMSGGFGKGGSTGMELFINDRPMSISRYPDHGFIRITEVLGKTPKDVRGTRGCAEAIFKYEGDRPSRWVHEPDARVLGYWYWDWADQRQRIVSIDSETKTMTLAKPYHGYGYRKGQWFYGFNLLCEIDRAGEWFLDRAAGVAYVWPHEGEPVRRAMVTILPAAVTLTGVSNLTLRGFIIEGSRRDGVVIKDCTLCSLVGCVVRNLGSRGVRVEGGRACVVRGCDVYGMGDEGVTLSGGDRKTLTPAMHLAENNHIHHYSRWNRTYRPGIRLSGVGNRMAHNLIHHAPHQAVGFGGNDHVIELNEIHNVCEESNDAGVMYAWNDWAGRGHMIRHNHLHHVYGHEARGCMGVYLDDNFSSATLFGNVFHQVPRAAFIGGGRDTVFENNVFVDCWPAVHVDARGLGWRAYGKPGLTEKLNKMPYRSEPWRSKYPQLLTLLEDEPMAPNGTRIVRNICVGDWDAIEGKAKPYVELKDNLLEVDPKFRDPERGNFRLRFDSPAFGLGFKEIPYDRIGLYEDPTRASWPVEHEVTVREFVGRRKGRQGAKPHTVKPFHVARARTRPRIDGRLSPGEWPAVVMPVAETPGREKIGKGPCAATLAHDGRTLYVAVVVPVKDVSKLNARAGWGNSDGMEICFRRHDKKPGPTFVLHGFSDGKWEVSREAGAPEKESDRLRGDVRYAAGAGDRRWVAEWAIPLEAAGIRYERPLALGFNIGVRRMETGEWIIWAGALGSTWQLDNAGRIVLD